MSTCPATFARAVCINLCFLRHVLADAICESGLCVRTSACDEPLGQSLGELGPGRVVVV